MPSRTSRSIQLSICLFCDSCRHQAILDREQVPESPIVKALLKRLRCTACRSRECSIRNICTVAGGFEYV